MVRLAAYMIIALADLSGAPAPAPAPVRDAYAEFRFAVERGTPGVLYVGVPAPGGKYGSYLSVDSLDGFAPGAYDCYPAGGRAMIAPRPAPVRTAVRAVLSASPCANGRCPK